MPDGNTSTISIHAPTRGATAQILCYVLDDIDFNPRSHEGSDMCPWIFLYHELNFNPRSHEGSDLCRRWIRRSIMISIHAPTRGATCFTHYDFPFLLYFNPRSHEGSDRYLLIIFLLADRFQSTLPRGERPTSTGKTGTTATISIHAPTRGATIRMRKKKTQFNISIHAPTRGATTNDFIRK